MKIEAAQRLRAGANEAMARKFIQSVTKVDSDQLTLVTVSGPSIIFTLQTKKNFDKAVTKLTQRYGKPEQPLGGTAGSAVLVWNLDATKLIRMDEESRVGKPFMITLVDKEHKEDFVPNFGQRAPRPGGPRIGYRR